MSNDDVEKIKDLEEEIKKLHELINENNEIFKNILKENNEILTKEFVKKFIDINEQRISEDPYEKLTKWSQDAMNQIKKNIAESIENNNSKQEKRSQKQADNVDKLLNKVVGLIEKIKKDDVQIHDDNPFYPTTKPFSLIKKYRSARNSISLLMAGIGLVVLSSGIWESAGELMSIQGRLIIGTIMVAMTAWLERRKVFALFGQE